MPTWNKEEFRLENIFGPVKDFAQKHGDFPVIVAGGIYYHEDIVRWVNEIGADGIQMGTRFAATHESGASEDFKQAIINCREEDIIVPNKPGSPCGLPFRIIKTSPGYQIAMDKSQAAKMQPGLGVAQRRGRSLHRLPGQRLARQLLYLQCPLCRPRLYRQRRADLHHRGRGHLVDQILSVDELMDELIGVNGAKG